jgi:hypothetical protein
MNICQNGEWQWLQDDDDIENQREREREESNAVPDVKAVDGVEAVEGGVEKMDVNNEAKEGVNAASRSNSVKVKVKKGKKS